MSFVRLVMHRLGFGKKHAIPLILLPYTCGRKTTSLHENNRGI